MSTINFDDLNRQLNLHVRELLAQWLPGGKVVGQEYMVASLLGGTGDSLRFNLVKCIGSDFATGDKFGDLIDLYAKINNLSQSQAAHALADQYSKTAVPKSSPAHVPAVQIKTILPPDDSYPNFKHFRHGEPSQTYCYRNAAGERMYYMCRYETPAGKQFFPFSYFSDNKWHMKAQDMPRPLYLLDELSTRPNDPVLIVEGEKSADAAKKFVSNTYTVTTWSNGSQSFTKTDWKPIYGRSVLIWPDGDEAGIKAAYSIAKLLSPHCPEIKIINVDSNLDGFDAADSAFTWGEFYDWAKPKIEIYNHNVSRETSPEPELLKPRSKSTNPDDPVIDGSLYAIWESVGLATSENGQPICNLDNALRVLEGFPLFTDIIWFDEFHQKYYTLWQDSKPREWADVDTLRLTTFMQRKLGIRRISDDIVTKAIRVHGKNNTRNEPKDWLNSLVWDGEARISKFLNLAAGAEINEYVTAASQNFWLSMVARIFMPGCQVDNMIVIEGAQGKGKTSLLRTIGQNWYCSAKEQVTSNNFFQMLQGKILIEIAELDSFNRAEITRIKQVVSDPVDRYRTPYDVNPEDHPRQSIFVGTTNEYAYLRDDTGGRRFWPIKSNEINLSYVTEFRDQLFAEATALIKSTSGACWWQMPESTLNEQEQRRQIDPWEENILDYALSRFEVTTVEIMNNCLHIEKAKQSRFDEMRIGKILHNLKWGRVRKRNDGVLRWVYVSPNSKPSEQI